MTTLQETTGGLSTIMCLLIFLTQPTTVSAAQLTLLTHHLLHTLTQCFPSLSRPSLPYQSMMAMGIYQPLIILTQADFMSLKTGSSEGLNMQSRQTLIVQHRRHGFTRTHIEKEDNIKLK